jgi:hypothetical protein
MQLYFKFGRPYMQHIQKIKLMHQYFARRVETLRTSEAL